MGIYRVLVKTTRKSECRIGTFFSQKVLYCGTKLVDARIAYLTSVAGDYDGDSINPAIKSIIEEFESNPKKVDCIGQRIRRRRRLNKKL